MWKSVQVDKPLYRTLMGKWKFYRSFPVEQSGWKIDLSSVREYEFIFLLISPYGRYPYFIGLQSWVDMLWKIKIKKKYCWVTILFFPVSISDVVGCRFLGSFHVFQNITLFVLGYDCNQVICTRVYMNIVLNYFFIYNERH